MAGKKPAQTWHEEISNFFMPCLCRLFYVSVTLCVLQRPRPKRGTNHSSSSVSGDGKCCCIQEGHRVEQKTGGWPLWVKTLLLHCCSSVSSKITWASAAALWEQALDSCWDGRPCQSKVGRKVAGGCCTPFRGKAGSLSNTMLHVTRPISVPSGIFIHPAVWPQ